MAEYMIHCTQSCVSLLPPETSFNGDVTGQVSVPRKGKAECDWLWACATVALCVVSLVCDDVSHVSLVDRLCIDLHVSTSNTQGSASSGEKVSSPHRFSRVSSQDLLFSCYRLEA